MNYSDEEFYDYIGRVKREIQKFPISERKKRDMYALIEETIERRKAVSKLEDAAELREQEGKILN